jgi:hypothetical protein
MKWPNGREALGLQGMEEEGSNIRASIIGASSNALIHINPDYSCR